MTNMVYVFGSSIEQSLELGRAAIGTADYVSDLKVAVTNSDANNQMYPLDRDGLSAGSFGSSIMVGFIKHNGPAGYELGQKNMYLIGVSSTSTSTLTTNFNAAIPSANYTVYDLNTGILGSDPTGSNVYFAYGLVKDNARYSQ